MFNAYGPSPHPPFRLLTAYVTDVPTALRPGPRFPDLFTCTHLNFIDNSPTRPFACTSFPTLSPHSFVPSDIPSVLGV